MAKKRKSRSQRPERLEPTTVLCRGGDCGSRRKHPDVDHGGQLRTLQRTLGRAAVLPSKCLEACEHSNVAVVLPGAAGQAAGATAVWVGEVLDAEMTDAIIDWVQAGGPGVAEPATLLQIREFSPTRVSRTLLDAGEVV